MTVINSLPEQFEESGYRFSMVSAKDLRLLRFWLSEPHIVDWWTPPEEDMTAMEQDIDADKDCVRRYIVSFNGREFGFIQIYDPQKVSFWSENPQTPGTFGIDQFIGDPAMIGFGHGTNFIKAFVQHLRSIEGIRRLIVDPHPDNSPAIKCYQQVGFKKDSDISTPDGPAALMSIAF